MAAQRKHQQADQQLVRIYVSNGHRTSGGTGPGVVEVPLDEAQSLVARRFGRVLGPGEHEGELAARQALRGVTN